MDIPPSVAAPSRMEAAPPRDEDAPWVARARAGDREAFEALVRRHGDRLYRMLLGITGEYADAEDCVQNTFLKAFQHLGEFQEASSFVWWLMRIARNEGLETLRRRRSASRDSLDDWAAEDEKTFRPRNVRPWAEDPEYLCSSAEAQTLVQNEILKLPAKYRVVVMLRDLEQLSTEETAAALGLQGPAVKSRLLRGRLMLREALAPHFGRPRLVDRPSGLGQEVKRA